jgi:hypothetical protein
LFNNINNDKIKKWEGRDDGYYSLNALNPGSHNFNYSNDMRINIKPDKGGISNNEMALDVFTTSKDSVPQNEMFTVTAQITSLGFFSGGQAEAALVDNNGNVKEVIGVVNFNELIPGRSRTSTINSFVPEGVNPGQYNLRIVTRPTGGDWKIIALSDISERVPNAIPITITAGEANGGGYGLSLIEFIPSKTTVSQNDPFTVSVKLKNIGLEAFPGTQTSVALVDNNSNITVIGNINNSSNALNPGSIRTITISSNVPNTVATGNYRLRIVVRPPASEEWRIATLTDNGTPTSYDFTVQ